MFSSNTLITGGTFTHVQLATIGGFERLQQSVSTRAFHNSGDIVDPPKCHPHTRIAVINKIMSWIYGLWEEVRNAVILWFYGPAGAGKSAIAGNIAERCDLEKILLAAFFFSRSDPARNNPKSLIATIAYQITTNLPDTRAKMIASIDRDPLILSRSLEAQVEALIVEPLRELLDAGYFTAPSSRRLIIIDGLDECDNPAVQCKVLDVISLFFQKYHLPLRILVASRPERHITHSFNTGSLPEIHTTLALDNNYQAHDDIRLFLTDNFREIQQTHPMKAHLDPSWPSIDVVDRLVHKSSGQFVYASTIMKYVSSIRHQPAARLDVVLEIRPPRHAHDTPFGELDTLYKHILSTVEDKEKVFLILGFHLIHPTTEMTLRDLEYFFLLDAGEIEMLFADFSSVIAISGVYQPIRFLHASLGDFFLHATRSQEFHIDTSRIHTTCMHLCFQHNKQYLASNHRNDSLHFRYAGKYLIWHCENALLSASAQLRQDILSFPLTSPHSCFARVESQLCLYILIPRFLLFIKTLPFEDADEFYNHNLRLVLNFFASKLHLYYASSRLTLLLTSLYVSPDPPIIYNHSPWTNSLIPLPSRLREVDIGALMLHRVLHLYGSKWSKYGFEWRKSGPPWKIFLDFLDSGHPLALDGQRYAIAAWSCLNIIFKNCQLPVFRSAWFNQHYPTVGLDLKHPSEWYLLGHKRTKFSRYVDMYWALRTIPPSCLNAPHKKILIQKCRPNHEFFLQNLRSDHFQFLLEKSAYSNNLINFARHRVFRFRYLHRRHPDYMKKAIFALAKYIQRVTGSTAEVNACESVWGRKKWFTTR